MKAEIFCLLGACAFFLTGLLTGLWKYVCMVRTVEARAPTYVDTAHRASLLYAFACTLLAQLCRLSAWSNRLNLAAAAVLVAFFAASVLSYIAHGALRDVDNQFQRPHRFGARTIPARVVLGFMSVLVLAEVGGFLVLVSGLIASLR